MYRDGSFRVEKQAFPSKREVVIDASHPLIINASSDRSPDARGSTCCAGSAAPSLVHERSYYVFSGQRHFASTIFADQILIVGWRLSKEAWPLVGSVSATRCTNALLFFFFFFFFLYSSTIHPDFQIDFDRLLFTGRLRAPIRPSPLNRAKKKTPRRYSQQRVSVFRGRGNLRGKRKKSNRARSSSVDEVGKDDARKT